MAETETPQMGPIPWPVRTLLRQGDKAMDYAIEHWETDRAGAERAADIAYWHDQAAARVWPLVADWN